MVAIVSSLLAMDKACAICIDMCETESVVRFKRKGKYAIVVSLVNGFESDSADYEVNADTLLDCKVRGNYVHLKVSERYGDPVPLHLGFMVPMKPVGFAEARCRKETEDAD